MKKFKYTFTGFLIFLVINSINVTISIFLYTKLENKGKLYISLLMLIMILVSSLTYTVIDFIRRKIMIEKPLKEILDATEEIAKGNFNIKLKPRHSYFYFDEYDLIKNDLNDMAFELSKSEVLKNDFIANLSHEIKTPLTIIQNYAKILEQDGLKDTERIVYLKNMQNACKKLNTLVNNILRLNKLENQKLSLKIEQCNLSEILTNQLIIFDEILDEKKIKLNCDIEENLFIKSEVSFLEIIFNNLMSNAIKFTEPNGDIFVYLFKKNDEFTIKFRDTGCGIDEEVGNHIFDKFYQGDTSHSKEGNGLGLALVKKIIEIIGGTICVESEIGVGTTFMITIKEI